MSLRKNTFDLDNHYDLTNSGQNAYVGQTILFSWGQNDVGKLGQNNVTYYSSPVQIPGTTWSSITGGQRFSLATKTDGTLWSWGYNYHGQLGQNNTIRYSSPVQIPGTTWSSISAGQNHTLATKTDGTLWGWGLNNDTIRSGRLGQNNTIARYSSPVQIPGTTWSSVSSGHYSSFAFKTDGTLWAWGYNDAGVLGDGTSITRSSPVQIPGTTWSSVSSGQSHTLATKTDRTLWVWGNNGDGPLGTNNATQYSSPIQIPGTTWSSIGAGQVFSLATKTDGTLWSWGRNREGGLGQNNRTYYSSPTQIPGTTWNTVFGGGGSSTRSLATKTDGTLWSWGYNQYGVLGQNDRTYRSSPVQIPGTNWRLINGGNAHSLATQIQ